MVKAKNKLEALSTNEEVGDIVTHWMKSGSAFRASSDLLELNEFGKKLIPKSHRGLPFEYDIWFNTNENYTVRKWLYTDFMGKGLYFRVPSVNINNRLFKAIINSDIKIDEKRVAKVMDNLQNKYYLQPSKNFYDKVIFLPGSNLLCKPDCIDIRRVDKLVKEGYIIKPHPITAHIFIAELRARYGYDKVLGKKEGGHELLLNASKIATAQNSEMGIVALLLGKDIEMVSFPVKKREKRLLTYESFYDALARTDAKKTILKLFSAKNSGIIFNFDEDADERLERYLANFWEYKIAL